MPSVKSLFDVSRTISKSNDKKLAQKVTSANKKAIPTRRGGESLLAKIANIQSKVEANLGKYREESMMIQDKETLNRYVDAIIEHGIVAIDTETTGLDPLQDDIAGIGICTYSQKTAYIPIHHVSYITNELVPNQLSPEVIRDAFQRFLDAKVEIVMFNATFDIRVLRHGIGLSGAYCTWDCYLAQRLLNENEPKNKLKPLYAKYVLNGQEDAFSFDDLFDKVKFTLIPLKTAYLYAAHDPKITLEFYDYQHKFIREDSPREDMRAIYKLFREIEMPCTTVVADMEDNGVLFDFEYNEKLKDIYHKKLDEREADFHKVCEQYEPKLEKLRKSGAKLDKPLNIKSTTQLAILLYDVMGCELYYDKRQKKEIRTTGEEHLKRLDNDVARAILRYREFSTLVDTFIDKLPNCVNPNDGRIHCKFNQYGADTGRFSSNGPNMQNIPSHDKNIRKMFVASPGYVLMSADYSQQEPKCLAAMCRLDGDSQLYNTFMAGRQLYADIASIAFHKPYEDCLEFVLDENGKETDVVNPEGKERRARAKKILLASLYGMGEQGIADDLNIPLEEAKKIKDAVYKGVPAIPKFEQDSLNFAYENGYVTTISGRKRRLPDLTLDEYEFEWIEGHDSNTDLLDFDGEPQDDVIPERTIRKYLSLLHSCRFREKQRIFKQANKEGIWIIDNGAKIAEATRKCVNSRIQGSAADLTKLAMVYVSRNERLKELGFRLLIQVHDELIGECPEENMKECSELLAKTMSEAAETLLEMPIKCDVDITYQWYGERPNEK